MTAPSRRRIHVPPLPAWHVATSDSVRAILANAYATDEPPTTIGDVTLMPHQRDALARVRNTIREFHGALLADEVGLGKTYVALALAHDYDHTHVVAPAALLPMWRSAIARSASQHVQLHSLHAFSRTPPTKADATHSDATPPARRTLVIIDEAHHLRTRNTQRYRAIADFTAGRDLLLLSATPIHNTSRELRHLLALFAGLRDDLLTPETLARAIIRQTTTSPNCDALRARSNARERTQDHAPPRVREHPPLRIPHDRATLDGILALPSPLPARDGAVAGALIRLGLLRAWCSSDSALTHVIQRRLLRGEALKQSLIAGRHPTQAELRTWLVGEHEVQLAFPELLTAHATESGPLLEVLTRHLDALESLLEQQRRHRVGDETRANALRELLAKHPDTPVIAFSQFTRTVQSLYRALSDIAGVGALTGMHAHIASGRIARLDAIARFAPTAQGRPPPPPHQAIRLLLSTDILAEGVNLQDAGVVVHLDLPWTDALRRQRVGRVARIGSTHHVVHVYSFAPHPSGDRALALTSRLLTKSTLAATLVGHPQNQTQNSPPTTPSHFKHATHDSNPPLKTAPTYAPADLATALHTAFQSWRATTSPSVTSQGADHARTAFTHSIPVAQLLASRPGWLCAISTPAGTQLVAHTNATGPEPARIWALLSAVQNAGYPANAATGAMSEINSPRHAFFAAAVSAAISAAVAPELAFNNPNRINDASQIPSLLVNRALRQLNQWLADRDITDSAGRSHFHSSRAQCVVRQRLAQVISTAPPLARRSLFSAIRTAEQVIESATGIGAESALEAWSRFDPAVPNDESTSRRAPFAWLTAWREFPALRRSHTAASERATHSLAASATESTSTHRSDDQNAPTVLGLLLFCTAPS